MPLLLMAGAAAVMLGGKKKRTSGGGGGGGAADDTGYVPSDTGGEVPADTKQYEPYTPSPKPKPATQTSNRPAGNPPPGDASYDGSRWGKDSEARLTTIRDFFKALGYPVEVGPWPMNVLGPKGTVELTNEPGSEPAMGKLGGEDDVRSDTVKLFQSDYNKISRLNRTEKFYTAEGGNLRGLDKDGMVGPYTLNGLWYAAKYLPGGKSWQDLLQQATLKGIS